MKNNIFYTVFLVFVMLAGLFFYSCKSSKNISDNKKQEIDEKSWFAFNDYLVEASKQKVLGNFNDAIQIYQNCIKIDPNNAAPYFELSNLVLSQGDWVTALKYSIKAASLDHENMWYQLHLAMLYQRNGMPNKSAEIYKNLIKSEPDRVDFYYNLSSILSTIGKIKEAIKVLDNAEKRFGVSEPVCLEKERLWMQVGNPKNAIAEIEKLIVSNPQEPRYYGILAESYVQINQRDKALEAYKKLLEIDGNNGLAHLSMSDYYRVTNEPEKSFSELKLAFESDDVDVDMKVKMLMSFIDVSEKNDAMNGKAYELLEILLKVHADDPKAHTLYADYLIKDKKYAEAAEQLRIVIKTEKDKFLIWEQLLYLEIQLTNNKLLYEESKEAMELFPNQPTAFMFNGLASFEMKNYQEAIDVLKKGLEQTVENIPLTVQFYTYLGEAYYRLKKYNESDQAFDNLLKIDPKNVIIMNNYSYYLSLRSDSLEKAERMIAYVMELAPDNATYLDTYAWVLYKRNKFEEAKKYLEKALRDGTSHSAVIVEHYGDIIYKLGDTQKALEQWKKAKEIGKGSDFLEQKISEGKLIE